MVFCDQCLHCFSCKDKSGTLWEMHWMWVMWKGLNLRVKTCQMYPHYEWLQYRSGNGKVLISLRRNLFYVIRKCEGAGINYYPLLTESWWKVNSQMDKRHIGSEKVRDFRICVLNFPLQYNKHWYSRTKPIDRAIVQEVKPASPDLTHTHIQVLAKFSSRTSKFRVRGVTRTTEDHILSLSSRRY